MSVNGLDEIADWIMGFGLRAEVMEPPELRAELLQRANALVELYGKPADRGARPTVRRRRGSPVESRDDN